MKKGQKRNLVKHPFVDEYEEMKRSYINNENCYIDKLTRNFVQEINVSLT